MLKQPTEAELDAHIARRQYGEFKLTQAISPSLDLAIVPAQGYKRGFCTIDDFDCPYVVASITADKLFEVFITAIELMPDEVDVYLENSGTGELLECYDCEKIVLLSTLWDYEDFLVNDGLTSLFIVDQDTPQEIQFDEHKLLLIYNQNLAPFEGVLHRYGVMHDKDLQLLIDGEHVHSSRDDYVEVFAKLGSQLNMEPRNG